ncbi:hypothetical protein BDV06DRAFT_218444 [Aspergillus oleicola]
MSAQPSKEFTEIIQRISGTAHNPTWYQDFLNKKFTKAESESHTVYLGRLRLPKDHTYQHETVLVLHGKTSKTCMWFCVRREGTYPKANFIVCFSRSAVEAFEKQGAGRDNNLRFCIHIMHEGYSFPGTCGTLVNLIEVGVPKAEDYKTFVKGTSKVKPDDQFKWVTGVADHACTHGALGEEDVNKVFEKVGWNEVWKSKAIKIGRSKK